MGPLLSGLGWRTVDPPEGGGGGSLLEGGGGGFLSLSLSSGGVEVTFLLFLEEVLLGGGSSAGKSFEFPACWKATLHSSWIGFSFEGGAELRNAENE